MRVSVYHNVARDDAGRMINYDGYQSGHPIVHVFEADVDVGDEVFASALAEMVWTACNLGPALFLPSGLGPLGIRWMKESREWDARTTDPATTDVLMRISAATTRGGLRWQRCLTMSMIGSRTNGVNTSRAPSEG